MIKLLKLLDALDKLELNPYRDGRELDIQSFIQKMAEGEYGDY